MTRLSDNSGTKLKLKLIVAHVRTVAVECYLLIELAVTDDDVLPINILHKVINFNIPKINQYKNPEKSFQSIKAKINTFAYLDLERKVRLMFYGRAIC